MMPDKNRMLNWLPLSVAGLLGLLLLMPPAQASARDLEFGAQAGTGLQLARGGDERGPDMQRRLQEWRDMPADKRERIKEKRELFERLDPAEKQRLRDEFRARQSRRERG